jgi:hypothetical protein
MYKISDKKQITCNRFLKSSEKAFRIGMHLSVEKDRVFSFPASCKDASLTRCRLRKIVSVSTERHIPTECNFCFIAIILCICYLFYVTKLKMHRFYSNIVLIKNRKK